MLFLPIGHDQTIRRFPWLTVAIMAICTLLQLQRAFFAPSMQELGDAARLREQQGYALIERMHLPAPELEGDPGAPTPIVVPPELAHAEPDKLLDAVRAGKLGDANDRDVIAYRAADANVRAVMMRDLVHRFGYRPDSGLSPNLLLAAFVHGGFLHLAGNLLFLWLCGCNLEDRWGRVAFGGLYVLSAIVSSLAYGLAHRGSDVPLVGASGAIAGVMGAFLVCFHSARIRYWWWWWFKSGTVFLPAYVAFPVWFLSQLGQSLLEVSGYGEVAYSAHVGGFVLGVIAAVIIRFGGIESRLLLEPEEIDSAPLEQLSTRRPSHRPSRRPYVRSSLRPAEGPLYADDPAILRAKVSSHPAAPFAPLSHAAEIPLAPRMPDFAVPDVAPWPPPDLAAHAPKIDSTVPIDSPFEALHRAVDADPSRDDLRYELCKHALDARDPELVDATATRTFLWLAEQERWRDTLALYDAFVASGIDRPLSDRAYSMIVRAAVETDDPKRCVQTAQKMANTHPQSLLLPRALWDVANAQERGGRPDYARKTFGMLIERFPQHRFAEEARKRIS